MNHAKLVVIFLLCLHSGFLKAQDAAAPKQDPKASSNQHVPIDPVKLGSTKAKQGVQATVSTAIQDCNGSSATAHSYCLAELNPSIQKASGIIGLLLSGIGTITSVSESCGKYNTALKVAETALTTYNGMCGAGQASCSSSCGDSDQKIKSAIQTLTAEQTKQQEIASTSGPAAAAAATEVTALKADIAALNNTISQIGNKTRVCDGYKMNLAAAGVGLMNVVKQSGLASTCQSQTGADCSKDPTNVACKTASVDCTKAENAQNTQCICMASPMTPGCAGYKGDSSFAPKASPQISGQSVDSTTGTPNLSGTDSGVTAGAVNGSSGGAGAVGSAGAGGGGGLGGAAGGSAKTGSADGKKEKTSANILSGFDGGGGGGGRSGGGRFDGVDSAYKAYLPGGAKDPNRGLASQTFGNGEVTGAGSKSNWEKVSERYLDSKPTLMGP